MLTDALSQLRQRLSVKDAAWLLRVGHDEVDVHLFDGRLAVGLRYQRVQAASEAGAAVVGHPAASALACDGSIAAISSSANAL